MTRTNNEAAERLRRNWLHGGRHDVPNALLDEALATERRNEWARIREALDVDVTERVRRCVTHHACACHLRLAEIGRRADAILADAEGEQP